MKTTIEQSSKPLAAITGPRAYVKLARVFHRAANNFKVIYNYRS